MHASGLWNFVPLETNADRLMGCHQMNLPEGFVCNHFLSIILLKQICLFKAFVSLLLSSPLFCQILIYFKTLIQISFLIFIAKLMLIIPSFELFDKNVTISFFSLHFFHFICYIFILQLIFLENTYYYESRRIFFMDVEKPFTFFMVKKGIKSNHNNLLLFKY